MNPHPLTAGYGSCSATFSDAVTTETTTTIETTHQVVTQTIQKVFFELSFKGKWGQSKISSSTTFDEKWTKSEKTTNTKTTTTVLTPSLTAQCMCPSTAEENDRECAVFLHTCMHACFT